MKQKTKVFSECKFLIEDLAVHNSKEIIVHIDSGKEVKK